MVVVVVVLLLLLLLLVVVVLLVLLALLVELLLICCVALQPFDRFFYNDTAGNYTVDRYLDSLTAQFGGIDSALLWPTVRCC